ncbi:cytochrome c oxidase subunit II [Bizionia arctica]|uniref:cytochrome-c oxidase n=1 Tax=Bizionia arctica TaxID=1495645 RepID=A0A917GK20_9FLAO|nr:cytochrome c oxidase subunit II [Bizionia arctica]GGG49274.1 cytochrome c oxidase subunit II [Bizionia arctica]
MTNHYLLQATDVELIANLFNYFLIVAGIIFALVIFYTFFYLIRYGAKRRPETPSQVEGSERVELILAIIATTITAVFVYLTINTMEKVQDIPENPKPFLEITGHQWWWEAKYPESGVITANQIYIPTGKKILLKLTSADVVHSWWVPELGRKMDMIAGVNNYMWMYAEKEGEYLGTCSEFCGVQHARMRIRVTALNPKDFEAWQQKQLLPVVTSTDALFLEGKQLFEEKTCTNCHAINGTEFKQNIGPNLTHFASRKRFLADMKENNEANLRAWLTNPQAVKSGVKMPNFILSDSEIDALVAYINGLK